MLQDHLSPNGLYVLMVSSYEMRMSHWVDNPNLGVAETKEILFQAPSLWSADTIDWAPDSEFVHLSMRVYPGSKPGLNIWLYPKDGSGKVQSAGATVLQESETLMQGTFEEVLGFLNNYETA